MATFSIVRAATSGFRFMGEQPKTFWTWFVAQCAVWLVVTVLSLGGLRFAQGDGMRAAVFFLPLALVVAALYLVQVTAVYRAVLRPTESRRAYYRVGRDELRQVLLFAMIIVVCLVASGVTIAAYYGLRTAVQVVWSTPNNIVARVAVLAMLPIGLLSWWAALRLSLLAAATFDLGRIDLRLAWRLTPGLVWRIVGCFLLLGLLVTLVQIPSVLTEAAAGFSASDSKFALVGSVLNLVLQIATNAVLTPVMIVPSAYIYKTLNEDAD